MSGPSMLRLFSLLLFSCFVSFGASECQECVYRTVGVNEPEVVRAARFAATAIAMGIPEGLKHVDIISANSAVDKDGNMRYKLHFRSLYADQVFDAHTNVILYAEGRHALEDFEFKILNHPIISNDHPVLISKSAGEEIDHSTDATARGAKEFLWNQLHFMDPGAFIPHDLVNIDHLKVHSEDGIDALYSIGLTASSNTGVLMKMSGKVFKNHHGGLIVHQMKYQKNFGFTQRENEEL
jgi:hypothetical protein